MAIKFIRSIPATKAEGVVADVYAAMKSDFMFAEPVSLHAPAPELLQAFWAVFRDVMVGEGETQRWEREVVAGAVSEANTCDFCMVTHAMMEKASPAPSKPRDRDALVAWSKSAMIGDRAEAPSFSQAQSDELRGVVVLFQYLNRMVSTFMEKASPFDPPADGRELTDSEKKMRQQIMAMVKAQMAKTVAPSGDVKPASVANRIQAGLPATAPAPQGAAATFAEMVAAHPSEISAELAQQALKQAGGDASLIIIAASSALNAARASIR